MPEGLAERWKRNQVEDGWGGLDYDDLVDTMGVERVSCRTFGEYQGDLVYLLKRSGQYGVLVVGYGSCSGCDALQGALGYGQEWTSDMQRDVTALRDQLQAAIIWPRDAETLGDAVEREVAVPNWWSYEDEVPTYLRKLAAAADLGEK